MMRLISVLFAIAMATSLSAQSLSDRDQRQVDGLSMMFSAALQANDIWTVIGFLPHPILDHIADQNGMNTLSLRRALVRQTEQMMDGVTIKTFHMDTENLVAGQTPTMRPYALVPTVSVIELNGQTFETETQTLFFKDDDSWFLLRLEDASQVEILKAVYPDFATLTLL